MNNIEIVEYIMQQKIANFIKENRNLDNKELIKNIEKMLDSKEEMYKMNDEELKQAINKMRDNND